MTGHMEEVNEETGSIITIFVGMKSVYTRVR